MTDLSSVSSTDGANSVPGSVAGRLLDSRHPKQFHACAETEYRDSAGNQERTRNQSRVFSVRFELVYSLTQLRRPDERGLEVGSSQLDDYAPRTATDRNGPSSSSPVQPSIFSDTRGVIKYPRGGSPFSSVSQSTRSGTTFALATSLFGEVTYRLQGNIGYGLQRELPTTGFRTSFSRGDIDVSRGEAHDAAGFTARRAAVRPLVGRRRTRASDRCR